MTPAIAAAAAAFGLLAALRAYLTVRDRATKVGERAGTSVLVRRRGGYRELVLAGDQGELVQSRQSLGDPLDAGPGYVDGLHVGMLLRPKPRRVLFLGGGAGIAPRQFEDAHPGTSIDVVEDNPFVVAAATRYFGLRITPSLSLHVADGAAFVAKAEPGAYDLVVLDVYDARGIPEAFLAPATFEAIARALGPEGALVVNLVPSPRASEAALLATLGAALPGRQLACFDVPPANVIVLAAPHVPGEVELIERALAVTIAPDLVGIVRRRRVVSPSS